MHSHVKESSTEYEFLVLDTFVETQKFRFECTWYVDRCGALRKSVCGVVSRRTPVRGLLPRKVS